MAPPSQSLLFIFTLLIFPISHSIPFILLHGIGDQCSHRGVKQLIQQLSSFSGADGYCVEIGNGSWDSWFKPLLKQTETVCEKVKKMKELKGGYNIIGFSQGNLIGRGVVEFCEGGPPDVGVSKPTIMLGGTPNTPGDRGLDKAAATINSRLLTAVNRRQLVTELMIGDSQL